jgi:hypothetical protein
MVLPFRELMTSVNPFVTVWLLLFSESCTETLQPKRCDELMLFLKPKQWVTVTDDFIKILKCYPQYPDYSELHLHAMSTSLISFTTRWLQPNSTDVNNSWNGSTQDFWH